VVVTVVEFDGQRGVGDLHRESAAGEARPDADALTAHRDHAGVVSEPLHSHRLWRGPASGPAGRAPHSRSTFRRGADPVGSLARFGSPDESQQSGRLNPDPDAAAGQDGCTNQDLGRGRPSHLPPAGTFALGG
jgi:hypothetical protein